MVTFFLSKKKTAYEMRISDWSSDVCSSDLPGGTMDEPDFHQQEEDRFARDLAEKINAMALAGQFDALVVVAPARTMGELRPLWHKEVAARIIGEHVQEMTERPIPDTEARLVREAPQTRRAAARKRV